MDTYLITGAKTCASEVIDHLKHGRLHPEVLISKKMHGSQAQQAFELLKKQPEENIKVLLEFRS